MKPTVDVKPQLDAKGVEIDKLVKITYFSESTRELSLSEMRKHLENLELALSEFQAKRDEFASLISEVENLG